MKIEIKNEKDLKGAEIVLEYLEKQVIRYKTAIQEYNNKNNLPKFSSEKDSRDFICYCEDGDFVEIEGVVYEVNEKEDRIEDYGYNSVMDCITNGDFSDLLDGGSLGILYKK